MLPPNLYNFQFTPFSSSQLLNTGLQAVHISIVQAVCMIIRMCSLKAVGIEYDEVQVVKIKGKTCTVDAIHALIISPQLMYRFKLKFRL